MGTVGWLALRPDGLGEAIGYWRMGVVCDAEGSCHESNGWLHFAADGSGQQCDGAGNPDPQENSWDERGYHWGGYTHAISFKRGTLRLTEDRSGRSTTLVRVAQEETPQGCGWGGRARFDADIKAPPQQGREPFDMTRSKLSRCSQWVRDPEHYAPGWHCRSTLHWSDMEFSRIDDTVYWEDPLGWCRCIPFD